MAWVFQGFVANSIPGENVIIFTRDHSSLSQRRIQAHSAGHFDNQIKEIFGHKMMTKPSRKYFEYDNLWIRKVDHYVSLCRFANI